MSELVEEPITLVRTGNSTSRNLAKENYYESILMSNSKFLHYANLYNSHLSKDSSNLIKEDLRANLTGSTLVGDDKISFRGKTFYFIDDAYWTYDDITEEKDDNYSITFFHLGSRLSGHEGIVHGGLLATLLDELTCRLAFQNFHSKKGVTANLNINYKKPCYVDSYVLIKCKILKKIGRKCWVRGSIYNADLEDNEEIELEKNLLTECDVLVIEPRWVQELKK